MTAIEKYCMNTLAEYASMQLLDGKELDEDIQRVLSWLIVKEDIVAKNNELSKIIQRGKKGENVGYEYGTLKKEITKKTYLLKEIENGMPIFEINKTYRTSEELRKILK